jgi:acetyl esterase/lipase
VTNAWRALVSLVVLPILAAAAFGVGAEETAGRRTFTYKTVGSLAIQADVFRPSLAGPRPVVLWIHGGALIFGGRGMLPAEQRELYLRQGWAVVAIDYRLAPETKLAVILEDVDDAHAWVLAQAGALGLDPDRLAVVGHSAGGYLALMTGVRFRPRPRAIVSFYGYGDIAGAWYSRPDPFYRQEPDVSEEEARRAVGEMPLAQGDEARRFVFYRYCRQRGLWPQLVAGHDPDREPRAFDPFCPVRKVTRDYPPTLLVHGEKDRDVPFAQSVAMARALVEKGVAHDLVALPGRDHVFDLEEEGLTPKGGLRDPEVARAFARVAAFLGEHLGK